MFCILTIGKICVFVLISASLRSRRGGVPYVSLVFGSDEHPLEGIEIRRQCQDVETPRKPGAGRGRSPHPFAGPGRGRYRQGPARCLFIICIQANKAQNLLIVFDKIIKTIGPLNQFPANPLSLLQIGVVLILIFLIKRASR